MKILLCIIVGTSVTKNSTNTVLEVKSNSLFLDSCYLLAYLYVHI